MSKIDLDPITSGYNLSKINANFQKVEDELNNKVLYRDSPSGEPNSMSSNLDMNSKSILNANKISSSILELGGVQVVPTNLAVDPYNGTREALRRSYAAAGYSLVDGSFEAGGILTSAVDVLMHEGSGKAYSSAGPYPCTVFAGTNPSVGGFTDRSEKLDYEVSVTELGAVPDYLLPDGSVNPTPTDNWAVFNAIFNGIDRYKGMHLFIPPGSFYCSKQIDVVYQTNNPWLTTFGTGRLHIRGAGLGSTNLVFPKAVNNGLRINTASPILSNLFIEGFSLIRVGFTPDDYQARPYIETFDFSGEPLFGVGLDVRQNGYLGGIHDIGISGFYVGLRQQNVYNGSVSRVFVQKGSAIYGFLGIGNTTLNIKDSNFWGYQACYCSSGGDNYVENTVCEGNMDVFNTRPDLLAKFAGHSYWQTSGILNMCMAYTEKCVGYARGLLGVNYHEVGGIASNGLGYHYYATGGDALSSELKAAIDLVNPNLISTYYKTQTGRTTGKIENSLSYHTDVYWIEDSALGANSIYTNCFSTHGTTVASGGFTATLGRVFKKHIPSDFHFVSTYSTTSAERYMPPTNFTGTARVRQDYYNNFSGYGVGGWVRRWDPAAPNATIGMELHLNLDGTITYKYEKKDSSGSVIESTNPLIISKTSVTAEQLFIRGDNGTLYRIRVNSSGQVIASTS